MRKGIVGDRVIVMLFGTRGAHSTAVFEAQRLGRYLDMPWVGFICKALGV